MKYRHGRKRKSIAKRSRHQPRIRGATLDKWQMLYVLPGAACCESSCLAEALRHTVNRHGHACRARTWDTYHFAWYAKNGYRHTVKIVDTIVLPQIRFTPCNPPQTLTEYRLERRW